MAELSLGVERREKTGKNAARRLRAEGLIPAVVYGGGLDSVKISVARRDMLTLLSSGAGENAVFLLEVPGTKERRHTMIRELQVHPLERRIIHVDFQRIEMSESVRVKVAIEPQGIPMGVKNDDGIIDFVTRELEVECLPNSIPERLVLDISALYIGQHTVAGDIELPDGVELVDDPERVMISIAPPRVVEEEEEVVEEDELLEGDQEEPEVLTGKEQDEDEAED